MYAINIRKAQREGARLVIGIAGISGSGKTFTALQLAFGLANFRADKVGFLDTENRRGSLYARTLTHDGKSHEFLIGDLYAPFSPERYIQAIHQFQEMGVEVLVIDSVTHEWEGVGGCDEIANGGDPKFPRWNKAKEQHKRFMNAMLQCDMHIIACIRAREKIKIDNAAPKDQRVQALGVQPIQEKNFMFEMTASLMMWDGGKQQQILKCPDDLKAILGRETGYITSADGKSLRNWVDGAAVLNPKVEQFRNKLQSNTERGAKHIGECWEKTPLPVREALGDGFRVQLFAAAAAYDKQKTMADDGLAELNNQVLGATTNAA